MPVSISYSSRFRKSVQKYASYRQLITRKIGYFQQNPYDSRLKTHKLSGALDGKWSFSLNHSLRVLFIFIDKSTVHFIDLGTHEIYR